MNAHRRLARRSLFGAVALFSCANLPAQVPQLINYQGRVAVGSVNFDGAGLFKFALVNATGTTTYWSNDGTSTAGGQPTAAVPLTVTKGLYSLLLGDVTLTNMSAVPAAVFTNADVRLRVWFNDGSHGFQLLSPDQRLAPNGYLPAGSVGSAAIANGAVTAAKIGVGAVGSSAIATGSITNQDFAPLAVDTAAIANAAVTTAKLAPLAVDSTTIADAAITSPKLAPFAVNAAAIADAAITTVKLAPLAVDSAAIANGAILTAKLAPLAVDSAALGNGAITSAKFAPLAVNSAALANGAVTTAKLAPLAVDAAALASGAITAPKIANGAVGSAAIAGAAITTDKIASGVAINGSFNGPLTGNVTGDVTGNVTGSATYFATPLRGDVVNGQGGSWASVIRLNGIPLKPIAPLHDQVLKYGTSGYWEPADSIPGPIEGDVIGENQKETKVVQLQGTPIAAGVPVNGQLLQFNGTAWTPVSIVPITSGGTGSNVKNFVDLTTDQNIAGKKTFTVIPNFSVGLEAHGTDGTTVNAWSVTGDAVGGGSNSGVGVYGESVSGDGVVGYSATGHGVSGECATGMGVYGNTENGFAVLGESDGGSAIHGISNSGNGVYGRSTTGWAGGFDGRVYVNKNLYANENLYVGGTLYKAAGSFKIDHPQDPANKYLSHSFVESPDMMNVYNGNIVTDADGLAIVTLPDYFMALNRDFRYQLTVIGQFAQAIIAEEIAENKFTIQTDKGQVKVSWQVTGIRQDAYANAHRIAEVEEKVGEERGRYLNPDLFGQSAEKGINNPTPPASLQPATATPAAGNP